MAFIVGIDTGGTFTDCVVIDPAGRIVTTKASSTPQDFSQGVMASLRLAAESSVFPSTTFSARRPRLIEMRSGRKP